MDQWERGTGGTGGGRDAGVAGARALPPVNRQDWREVIAAYAALLRANLFPTLVYCTVYLSFGISVAYLGPTGTHTSTPVHADLRVLLVSFSFSDSLLFRHSSSSVFRR